MERERLDAPSKHLAPQSVGAAGEKLVEVELLRRHWLTANVNASIRNAEGYDIFAQRSDTRVSIRVKTCSARLEAFQFGGFHKKPFVPPEGFPPRDFTVLVLLGAKYGADEFWVMPTLTLRKQLANNAKEYLSQCTRAGTDRIDTGQWTLHLHSLKDESDMRQGYGNRKRWEMYANAWHLLEKA